MLNLPSKDFVYLNKVMQTLYLKPSKYHTRMGSEYLKKNPIKYLIVYHALYVYIICDLLRKFKLGIALKCTV